jgi:c-di-GMP-binding flagellar brake protein YcgR
MNKTDRRKYERVEASNPISYESINKDGEIVLSSMGRTLNVSRTGIMLEITHLIKAEYVSLSTVDLEDNLIKIKGQLIYCRRTDSGLYQAGIRFIATDVEQAEFAVQLIRLHYSRKDNMIVNVAA